LLTLDEVLSVVILVTTPRFGVALSWQRSLLEMAEGGVVCGMEGLRLYREGKIRERNLKYRIGHGCVREILLPST
jgi:hypothetical protein